MAKLSVQKNARQVVESDKDQYATRSKRNSALHTFGEEEESLCMTNVFQPPPKKQVSFNQKCRVKFTEHLNNFSDHEYYACWHTPEELQIMREDLLDTLYKLERKEMIDEITDTFRGLETHTKRGKIHKGQCRTAAIAAVIGAYDKQAEIGARLDEKCVADMYKECSQASKLTSYLSGMGDQRMVRELDISSTSESLMLKKSPRRNGFMFPDQ